MHATRATAALMMISAVAIAAGEPTASQPATTTDWSTPKAAFRTYTTALRDGDRDLLMKSVVPSDKTAALLDGQLAYNVAEQKFRAAAIKAYPESAKELPDSFASSLAAIEGGEVKVDADQATLTTKQTMQPVKLKKIDGQWKVDLGTMFSPPVMDEIIGFRKAFTDVMDSLTDDIGRGKFTDYNDMRGNLETRLKMHLAMPPAEATTKP